MGKHLTQDQWIAIQIQLEHNLPHAIKKDPQTGTRENTHHRERCGIVGCGLENIRYVHRARSSVWDGSAAPYRPRCQKLDKMSLLSPVIVDNRSLRINDGSRLNPTSVTP